MMHDSTKISFIINTVIVIIISIASEVGRGAVFSRGGFLKGLFW